MSDGDSYEVRLERFLAPVTRMAKQKSQELTLVGPPKPQLNEAHRKLVVDRSQAGLFKCDKCNPPEEVLTCTYCDWEVPVSQRWRMKMHNDHRPAWCIRRERQKVARFSRQA